MSDNAAILITRPEPHAGRFASACRAALGHARIIVSPLQATQFADGPPIEGHLYDAAAFTSQAGVEGAARLWTDPKGRAFAVGDSTAQAARLAGWDCASAGGSATGLAALVAESHRRARLVWPCGGHGGAFAGAAREAGLSIDARTVYVQQERPPSDEALRLLAGPGRVILPLFSARSAKLAKAAVDGAVATVLPVAISHEAARAMAPALCRVASAPNAQAVLTTVVEIFGDPAS